MCACVCVCVCVCACVCVCVCVCGVVPWSSSCVHTWHRVPLPTLIKCKTALEKMFEQQQLREHLDSASSSASVPPPSISPALPTSVPPPPSSSSIVNSAVIDPPMPPTTKPLPEPKSQSLHEFKMIPSPTPTFGNLVDTIQSRPFPADRLPPSKRLCNRG